MSCDVQVTPAYTTHLTDILTLMWLTNSLQMDKMLSKHMFNSALVSKLG